MDKIINFSNTAEGKAQSKRLVDCRFKLGCPNAKVFFEKYSQGRFSYPQYQKYESGERLLSKKAAILYAGIFDVDWEWLKENHSESFHKTNFPYRICRSRRMDGSYSVTARRMAACQLSY